MGEQLTEGERASLYERDIRVNKLERSVRARVRFFLAGNEASPNL